MATLQLWHHPKYYMGETYEDYYPVVGQSRDSDTLEQSNFAMALGRLGGESDTVIVARASHWAVGWVESLLIHKDATDKVAIAQQIADDLENYPVLDDEDFGRREYDAACDNVRLALRDYSHDHDVDFSDTQIDTLTRQILDDADITDDFWPSDEAINRSIGNSLTENIREG